MSRALVLAIETSCDETAVAILRAPREILASEVASQIDLHKRYGGVVPEVASRNHLPRIRPLIETALHRAGSSLTDIDCVAATRGPGLLTSLLVGYSAAKGLAIGLGKPFIGINHLEGHLLSPLLPGIDRAFPSIGLIVSGGHTLLVRSTGVGAYHLLGRTLDDAAGEAFDKVAKLLDLPYPGGPEIDRLARQGNPKKFDLPRSMAKSGDFNFSFSGLKTAVRYLLPKLEGDFHADLCASFQEAVVDVLVQKTIRAAERSGVQLVTVSGGVSANSRLRSKMLDAATSAGLDLKLASPSLSTDNAAMIAYAALERYLLGYRTDLREDADPNLQLV
ncbi:MAG TPA: tRNA (adenosine(37)-N6)-threonylcarbamoyltransferase complex transferase subunit TsaD [Chthoniobacterales bacterium]|nr:tRNA (adenosine(37)-N6)-threonylcarbamoyltransferase complex transferase subunit TsaD [Chthoniobacterales bacterium]